MGEYRYAAGDRGVLLARHPERALLPPVIIAARGEEAHIAQRGYAKAGEFGP